MKQSSIAEAKHLLEAAGYAVTVEQDASAGNVWGAVYELRASKGSTVLVFSDVKEVRNFLEGEATQ